MLIPVLVPRRFVRPFRWVSWVIVMPVVVTLTLGIAGLAGLIEALSYQHKQVTSCEEFVKALPGDGWFRVTGAVLDMPFAWHREGEAGDRLYYVPMLPEHFEELKAHVLLVTRDPRVPGATAWLKTFQDAHSRTSDAEFDRLMDRNYSRFFPRWQVEGMVTHLSPELRTELAKDQSVLADDFVAIEDGKRPMKLSTAITLMCLGTAAGIGTLGMWAFLFGQRNRRQTAAQEAQSQRAAWEQQRQAAEWYHHQATERQQQEAERARQARDSEWQAQQRARWGPQTPPPSSPGDGEHPPA